MIKRNITQVTGGQLFSGFSAASEAEYINAIESRKNENSTVE